MGLFELVYLAVPIGSYRTKRSRNISIGWFSCPRIPTMNSNGRRFASAQRQPDDVNIVPLPIVPCLKKMIEKRSC